MLPQKKSYRKFIYSPFTLLLLLVILLLLFRALWGVHSKERISARYLEKEQEQLAAVITRQKELTQSVNYLKTDKGVEAEIRSKFRVVREGESVAVIIDNNATSTTPAVATTTPKGFWKKLWKSMGL